MPRFYFDVRRDSVVEPDRDGLVLPSRAIARAEASRAAVDMIRDAVPEDTPDIVIVVRDEQGKHLFEVEVLVRVQEH
jgi:hypothetical protein